MDKLIKLITEGNKSKGVSNRQFALDLGIDPGSWSLIRRGKMGLSLDFIRKLARKRPELALAIQDYIFREEKEAVNVTRSKERG